MDSKPNRDTSLGQRDICLANIPIDCMILESEFRELEAFRESKMIKRLEWNVNEEIAEDILKAEEKYNMYENSHTFLIIHSTYFQNLHFYLFALQ